MKKIRRLQQGFTVIEVVIAFVILSIVTVVAVSVVTQNTMRTHRIEKQLIAMEVAENALAQINGNIIFEKLQIGGEYQGETNNGYKWKAAVNTYNLQTSAGGTNRILPLWKVNLQVFDKVDNHAVFQISTVVPGK
jgi:type II secretion system protein I